MVLKFHRREHVMIVEQIRVGLDNFSYLIYCGRTKKAVLVDPGYDATKALARTTSAGLELVFMINTHHHADHTSDNRRVLKEHPEATLVVSKEHDMRTVTTKHRKVSDGELITVGQLELDFLLTPGHTPDGLCIIVDNKFLLTGDTLFIGDCGRCDLPGGDLATMFDTLQKKIMSLPDHLVVYPGHDYGPRPYNTLGAEKRSNKVLLARDLREFSGIP